MFLGNKINVPVILQGPSMDALYDKFKNFSDATSQMGTPGTVSQARYLNYVDVPFRAVLGHTSTRKVTKVIMIMITGRVLCSSIKTHTM